MKLALTLLTFVFVGFASAQTAKLVSGPAITGTMDIVFNTRTAQNTDADGKPNKGVKDVYNVDLKVGAVGMKGRIDRTPKIAGGLGGLVGGQRGQIYYAIVLNVKDTYVGDWLGTVVTSDQGYFLWNGAGDSNSRPRIQVQSVGPQAAFVDFFGGVMVGRGDTPTGSQNFVRKLAGGKVAVYTAKNTDPMDFQGLNLARGPLGSHSRVTVNGKLIYDRESGSWITDGIKLSTEGKKETDTITGSIRWIAKTDGGGGDYVFNLRWNEAAQQPNEENFTANEVDEDAFFAVDTAKPGLTGKISYEDKTAGETVISSSVKFDLQANNIERNQILAFAKLWLVGVGPLNDE